MVSVEKSKTTDQEDCSPAHQYREIESVGIFSFLRCLSLPDCLQPSSLAKEFYGSLLLPDLGLALLISRQGAGSGL